MEQTEKNPVIGFDTTLSDAIEYCFQAALEGNKEYDRIGRWLFELQELRKLKQKWIMAKKNLLWLAGLG